jgi:F0F1-type ATP synthase epsilon subunit
MITETEREYMKIHLGPKKIQPDKVQAAYDAWTRAHEFMWEMVAAEARASWSELEAAHQATEAARRASQQAETEYFKLRRAN